MADVDRLIIEATRWSDGLLTLADLRDAGLSDQGRRTRVADARLQLLPCGIYLLGGLPVTWKRRLHAAHLATGGVISHMAAAAHWGFEGIGTGAVEVTVAYGRSARMPDGRTHRSRNLEAVDVVRSARFPVTRPERTLFDIATRTGPRRLARLFDDACRQGLVDKSFLRWRMEHLRRARHPGASTIRRLVDRPGTDVVLDSWLERRAAEVIDDSDLPPGTWQVEKSVDGKDCRVDLSYEHVKLVVEFDGHGTHATREERQADDERMARLTLTGHCVVRFTYDDVVGRPEHVVQVIKRHLEMLEATAVSAKRC